MRYQEPDLISFHVAAFSAPEMCFSTASKLTAIYIADTEKYPVLFIGQKTSCRGLMDFTSAIPVDPRGTSRRESSWHWPVNEAIFRDGEMHKWKRTSSLRVILTLSS